MVPVYGRQGPFKGTPKKAKKHSPRKPWKNFPHITLSSAKARSCSCTCTGKEEGITRGAIQPTPGAGGEVPFLGHMGCTEEIVYEK